MAEFVVAHQGEQVLVAAHEVPDLTRDREIDVRLIIRVPGVFEPPRDFGQHDALPLDPFEESRDTVIIEMRPGEPTYPASTRNGVTTVTGSKTTLSFVVIRSVTQPTAR